MFYFYNYESLYIIRISFIRQIALKVISNKEVIKIMHIRKFVKF